ncbi:MAG: dihydrofolate reductase [Gammaproteobacteria bacterium]|nr:MAG: dihydrofolate reductase [Gammaproteobacteria bacterium]
MYTTQKIPISLIVAASQNDVIGKDNGLPWHLPRDLRYFKDTTIDCPVIMGRKTYESIGRALPNRYNIVVTRGDDLFSDADCVSSIEDGIDIARQQNNVREVFIIGGASIFEQALNKAMADKIYLNRVLADIAGDTLLPDINWTRWELQSSETHEADAENPYGLRFETYRRMF